LCALAVNGTERAESYYLVIALSALVTVAARYDHREARDSALGAYFFKISNARREKTHSGFGEKVGFFFLACNLVLVPDLGGACRIVAAPVAGASERQFLPALGCGFFHFLHSLSVVADLVSSRVTARPLAGFRSLVVAGYESAAHFKDLF